ncbi:2-hydroxychromene-2-carboxylate isomerase [Novosphingobium sp.]|uniref:2-hydroxychromene-2-carboxylate isomerase n=1 Tax=Novosphingobium sp. TaxID=1874826 RepID=UPI0035AFD980
MTDIVFYFDFGSPYAYFARHKLVEIAARHGCGIDYRPIDLKRAKLESGNNGPPTVAIPNKLAFANRDFARWAERYGVPFKSIGGIEGVRELNIGALYALNRGQGAAYIERVFDHCWGHGGRPDDQAFVAGLIADMGWDADDFRAFVASDAAAAKYESVFQLAVADHVFGVPAFVIGDELWWGNDRLFMVDEYLAERAPAVQAAG